MSGPLGRRCRTLDRVMVGITTMGWIGEAGLEAGVAGRNAGTKQAGHQTGTQEAGHRLQTRLGGQLVSLLPSAQREGG